MKNYHRIKEEKVKITELLGLKGTSIQRLSVTIPYSGIVDLRCKGLIA